MPGPDVLVLSYHAVSANWPAPLSVTPEAFEYQIGLLASRGYRGATFTEAALRPGPGKTVAVTFDDGYTSVDAIARPILERHGMVATVFVPTRFIGSEAPMVWPGIDEWLGGPHERELMPMSWPDLRSLADRGWEVGSHTLDHPHLTELEDSDLGQQLTESRQQCSAGMDRECTSIAFPYGDADERVMGAAEAAGYSAAALLTTELERTSAFGCPRIGVYNLDGQRAFRVKVSPAVRRLRASRAWPSIARLLHSARRG